MGDLHADQLLADPRVLQARQLILDAVSDHQQKLTGVKPADPALKESYAKTVEHFSQMRGGKLFYPYLGSGIGRGPLVELTDGSVKYDFIIGIGVHYWGHSHPDLVNAGVTAALGDTTMQGHLQQNREQMALTELILSQAPEMDHCFLTTTGVMANENALKIILQKKEPRHRILAFEKCFAGRTLALSQVTDKPAYRSGLPATYHVDYVPFYDVADPEGSTKRAVSALRAHLARYPEQHAAMMFELVQGEGGFNIGTHAFFKALMEIAKEHDVAVLADEVQTFGRTGSLFAYQHFGLEKYVDLVTIGKLSQVCATLYRSEYKPRPGLLSQTFTASTATIHAAHTIISGLVNDGYLGPEGRITEIHTRMTDHLERIRKAHPGSISGPYGIGAMVAFTPFDGSAATAKRVGDQLFENGVVTFLAGANPARIRFLIPAGGVTNEDIDAVAEIVEQTLLQCAPATTT